MGFVHKIIVCAPWKTPSGIRVTRPHSAMTWKDCALRQNPSLILSYACPRQNFPRKQYATRAQPTSTIFHWAKASSACPPSLSHFFSFFLLSFNGPPGRPLFRKFLCSAVHATVNSVRSNPSDLDWTGQSSVRAPGHWPMATSMIRVGVPNSVKTLTFEFHTKAYSI